MGASRDAATASEWGLVGRTDDLAALDAAAEHARAGHSTVVVITGEAGIGKSLLLGTSLRRLERKDFRVLPGRAERMEQGIAYASLRQAIDSIPVSWPTPVVERAAQLRKVLDRPGWSNITHPSFEDVYWAVTRLFVELCRLGPAVLALDDLHVADADTVNLLALLARRLRGAPLLIVLSRRSDPPAGSIQAIDQLESALDGEGALVHLPLGPLSAVDIEALVESVLGAPPDAALVGHVTRRSGGNPFFALETLHALQSRGPATEADAGVYRSEHVAELTPIRRRAILDRIVPVDDAARSVAMTMAAFGHLSIEELPLLSDIAELDLAVVEHGFDQLFEVNVICRRDDGGYGFTHDLVAETLYEQLGPAARRRLHARIAEGLSSCRDRGLEVDVLRLAKHLDRSAEPGDVAAAMGIAAAGDEARGRAPRSAVRWYRRALSVLPVTAPERGPILVHLAQALLWAGSPAESATVCRQALELLTRPKHRERVIAILGEIAAVSGRQAQEEVIGYIDDEITSRGIRGRLLVVRGTQLTELGRYHEAIADAEAMVAAVPPSTWTSIQALFQLAHVAHCRGRVDLVRKYTARQLDEVAHLSAATRAYVAAWGAFHFAAHAQLDEAAEMKAKVVEITRSGPSLRTGTVLADLFTGWFAGEWAATRQMARQAADEFRQLGHFTSYAASAYVDAEISTDQGDPGPALALEPDEHPLGMATAGLLLTAKAGGELAVGHVEAARALLDRALGLPPGPGTVRSRWRLIEACLAAGDQVTAEAALDEMVADVAAMDRPLAEIILVLCHEQVTGGGDLVHGLELAQTMRLPFYEARLRLMLGRRDVDPDEHLPVALTLFDKLEAMPWRRSVATELRRHGLPVPRRSNPPGELTEAERAIALLVAEGLKNREIATRLCYSVKTVQAYLSRVYEKLGVRSRVELTRVLHQQENEQSTV